MRKREAEADREPRREGTAAETDELDDEQLDQVAGGIRAFQTATNIEKVEHETTLNSIRNLRG